MDSAWIQRPVKLIQSDSDGVIIIQTDSDKFQKNSDRFSLIQNFLFMRVNCWFSDAVDDFINNFPSSFDMIWSVFG